MGGATSIGHFLAVLGPGGIGARLGGLCDAGQEAYLRRALARGGLGTSTSRAGLEARGCYVCVTDLEDELIRAAGTGTVEQIIQAQGELRSLRIFQRQPAQRQRSTAEQLHRFLGTRSGRKSQYARLLAAALDPAQGSGRGLFMGVMAQPRAAMNATSLAACAAKAPKVP